MNVAAAPCARDCGLSRRSAPHDAAATLRPDRRHDLYLTSRHDLELDTHTHTTHTAHHDYHPRAPAAAATTATTLLPAMGQTPTRNLRYRGRVPHTPPRGSATRLAEEHEHARRRANT